MHIAVISINRRKLGQIQQNLKETGSLSERVGFYSPKKFISKLFNWAADDPEGGAIERGKLRKRQLDLGSAHLTEAERKENEREWLAEIAQRMKR